MISINGANVTESDDVSINGIIHKISQMLYSADMSKESALLVSSIIYRIISLVNDSSNFFTSAEIRTDESD